MSSLELRPYDSEPQLRLSIIQFMQALGVSVELQVSIRHELDVCRRELHITHKSMLEDDCTIAIDSAEPIQPSSLPSVLVNFMPWNADGSGTDRSASEWNARIGPKLDP